MKNNTLAIFALAFFALVGCQSERAELPAQGCGYVDFSCQVLPEAEVRAELNVTKPDQSEFSLQITGTEYDEQWDRLADYNVKENRMDQGAYTAYVAWGDPTQEGENLPYYTGQADFTILPLQTIQVPISATIANSVVQVLFTENFLRYFHDEEAVLTSAAGNEFTFTSADADRMIFVAPGEFRLNASAFKQTGDTFQIPEQKRTATAGTLHVIKFDLSTAGTAQVTITLNENLLEGITINQELNPDSETL